MNDMGLWVFGYGSLMWRPGFPYDRREKAAVHGFSRRLCVLSVHHRGTERRPGLVLGLDRGGACEGMAFHVPDEHIETTMRYLRAREQVNGVYRQAHVPISLHGPEGEAAIAGTAGSGQGARASRSALTFIAERAHPSYVGTRPLHEQAAMIRGASGLSGHNLAYVANTVRHLQELGIRDRELERLVAVVGPVLARHHCGAVRPAGAGVLRSARLGPTPSSAPAPLPSGMRGVSLRPDQRRRFGHRL